MAGRKYNNKTEYNRTKMSKTNHKKSMSMKIYRDKRLNFLDMGLLTWLLSSSKDYVINKYKVMERSGVPENKFLNSWKKLQELGFIEKRDIQGGVEWIIHEQPACYSD